MNREERAEFDAINRQCRTPVVSEWEKRARYAEAALRTILGSPGITLDGAQAIAKNYFDGAATVTRTARGQDEPGPTKPHAVSAEPVTSYPIGRPIRSAPIAQQSGKSSNPERDRHA